MKWQISDREIELGGRRLTYRLTRKSIKNLILHVGPDRQIRVSAPHRVPLEAIDRFVCSREAFIERALRYFANRPAQLARPAYTTGERYLYRGAPVTLQLCQGEREGVAVEGDRLILTVRDPEDGARKQALIGRFVREEGGQLFARLVRELLPLLACYDVEPPKLRMRAMKTRWGSCSPTRRSISLNLKLLELPESCAEYVVLHELCHLVHPNHSRAFYGLLTRLMPDWQARKAALDQRERQLAEGLAPLVVIGGKADLASD